MSTKRIFTIDIARAITIILVVLFHFTPEYSPKWWIAINSVFLSFGMQLFMAISGYTYIYGQRERKDRNTGYGNFILQKFQRLMIPYFFISVFVITVKLFVGGESSSENPVSLLSFLEMFYYPAAAPFVWFIYVLFMMFLVVPHFSAPKQLTALSAIALILHFVPVKLPDTFSYIIDFKSMLVFFLIGCLFYEWRNVRSFIINAPYLVYLMLFGVLYTCKGMIENHIWVMIFNFIISLTGSILVIKISKFISDKGKSQHVFLSIAACSYTIYMFHTTFMGIAKAVYGKIPLYQYIGGTATFIIGSIIVISTGIIAPMILHHFITLKSKILSYLIGAKYRK